MQKKLGQCTARLFWASWRRRKVLWRTVNVMKTLQPLTHSYPAQQSPFQGCQNVTLFPSPRTQVLPLEAAFSQHGVIRRKISSCQVGANQNSTNKPWHSTTPRVPAALGGEYRLVMNMACCRGSSGRPAPVLPRPGVIFKHHLDHWVFI